MAAELDLLVRGPWREVRRKVLGSPDASLHAADLRNPTEEQIEAITAFFTSGRFARIGVTITSATKLHPDLPTIELVAKALLNRIADVGQWTQLALMAVIFESSKRADPLLQAALADLRLEVDGARTPIEVFFMPKSANDPALEVADFIVHTAGGQARRKLGGKAGFRLDYQAIFQSVDRKLVSRFDIDLVEKNTPPAAPTETA
jgi:hypothetical protein